MSAVLAGPEWARWVFDLLFTAVGVVSAVRLVRAGAGPVVPGARAATADHLLMAAGMAVMFLPLATPVPPDVWALVFVGHAGTVAWRLARVPGPRSWHPGGLLRSHLVVHLVAAVTMALAFAAMPPDGLSGAAMAPGGRLGVTGAVFAAVCWPVAAYFLAHVVWCGVRLAAPVPPPAGPGGGRVATPVPARDDQLPLLLVMSLGMSYMLVTMM